MMAMGDRGTTSGLRQRKKDRLRAQIVETALTLFVERGYAKTTVDDITQAIDVSPRTFFRYFANKEDLIGLGPFDPGNGLREFVAAVPDGPLPLSIARDAMRFMARRYETWPNGLVVGRMIFGTPDLLRRLAFARHEWCRELAAGLEPRIDAPNARFEALVIAGCVQFSLAAAFEQWVSDGADRPLSDHLEDAFAISERTYRDFIGTPRSG